ncbi:GNVR domain-containing protein, partial [Pseudomonas aeruginosa]|uniref:GNVR domain-containing protein n=1 Tax=Pseudomonas aeruginosa TaxID=287 RepID=UPI002B27001F
GATPYRNGRVLHSVFAAAPDFPVKPKKLLILFGGVMLGGMLGMLFVVIRLFYRRNAKLS